MDFICTFCSKKRADSTGPVKTCECGKPLKVEYSWNGPPLPREVDETINSLWRYRLVLPKVDETNRTTLGEGWTPLIDMGKGLFVKDETVNPTGSFKDRGMALAITMAKQQGVKTVCLPSAGNAGVAAAAYARKAGIKCHVFLPETIPQPFIWDTEQFGAELYLRGKTIADAAAYMAKMKRNDWFDLSTLKEPFRVEGKKTLGYEIAEQLNWKLPDVIIYPTGGGTGLIGMWKAFREMQDLRWVSGPMPRMVAVQSGGCAPIVKAFEKGLAETEFWEKSHTAALGLNVPGPLGGYWILEILNKSSGIAVSVEEDSIYYYTEMFREKTEINASEEGGVVWSAYLKLFAKNWIKENETVIIFATGKQREEII